MRAAAISRAATAILLAALSAAADDLPFFGRVSFEVTAAGQYLDLRTHRHTYPTKYDEHWHTPEGSSLDALTMRAADLRRRSFLELRALDAGQHDEQIDLAMGEFGWWRTSASFDGYPRLFSRASRTPFAHLGHGRLVIHESLRRHLESAAGEELAASASGLVTGAPLTAVRFQRNRLSGGGRWYPRRWLEVRVRGRDEMRNGTRPFSFGTFERSGSTDRYDIFMFEFPEPVETRTDEVTFGSTLRGRRWHVDFDASASRYRNTIGFIDYDNPFRATHAAGQPGARGHITSPPNTTGQTLSASGRFDISERAQAGVAVTWMRTKQDQFFVPWTLNLAMPASGLPEGLGPTNFDALPRRTFKGLTTLLAMDDSLAVALTRELTLTLRYRDYDFSDRTPEIALPGYAGLGDAVWRTEFAGSPLIPAGRSFRRQSGQTDMVWQRGTFRARLTHEREIWTREHRQSGRTEEDSITAAAQGRRGDASGRATLRYRRRNAAHSLATRADVIRFDAGDLTRLDGRAHGQWTPLDRLTVTAAMTGVRSDHRNGRGLQDFTSWDGWVSARTVPFGASELMVTLSRGLLAYDYRHESWGRDVDDQSSRAGLDYAMSVGRWSAGLNYEWAFGSQRIVVHNGAATDDYPRVSTSHQRLSSDISLELSPRWQAGLRYRYAPFSVDDYATNDLSFYPREAFSEQIDASRVILLDARYGSHRVHLLGVYFRLKAE